MSTTKYIGGSRITDDDPMPIGNTAIGSADDEAWDGTGGGTLIALLKAVYAQNETITGLLNDIKTNTTPAG